jgi:nitrite reductase (NADH) small subunit
VRVVVCPVASIPPGTVKIIYPASVKAGVGIFNVGGEFYALKNICPHMGAPLCRGHITGTSEPAIRSDGAREIRWVRDGEVISCPWHHWEFDIKTGATLFPSRNRVRRYPVTVESPDVEARLRAGVDTFPAVVEDEMVIVEI